MRVVGLVVALVLACGAPAANAPSPRPSPSASPTSAPSPTVAPTLRPSPTAGPSPTRIVLPNNAVISAPSRDIVWALVAGDHLFRSIDRGATWEERPMPPGLAEAARFSGSAQISFVDDRLGWLLQGYPPGTGCQQQPYALWRTDDAGAAWSRISSDSFGIPSGDLFFACKLGIAFADRLRGVIVARARDATPTIYRTGDGGKTWANTRLAVPQDFKISYEGYALEPGQLHWFGSAILLDTRGDERDHRRFVYRSADGGQTWTHVATASVIGGFAFVTATRWVEIAGSTTSRETSDGGATWHAFATDYAQAAPIAPAVVFADASVGYATVRGAIQLTTDGGAHWTAIKTPGT